MSMQKHWCTPKLKQCVLLRPIFKFCTNEYLFQVFESPKLNLLCPLCPNFHLHIKQLDNSRDLFRWFMQCFIFFIYPVYAKAIITTHILYIIGIINSFNDSEWITRCQLTNISEVWLKMVKCLFLAVKLVESWWDSSIWYGCHIGITLHDGQVGGVLKCFSACENKGHVPWGSDGWVLSSVSQGIHCWLLSSGTLT